MSGTFTLQLDAAVAAEVLTKGDSIVYIPDYVCLLMFGATCKRVMVIGK